MFESLPNSVQLIASNALSSLTFTIARAVTLSSAEQVSNGHYHEDKEQFILSNRQAKPMSGEHPQNTRSVSRFLSEFEEEESSKRSNIEYESTTRSLGHLQRFDSTQTDREHSDGRRKSATMFKKPPFSKGQLQPTNTLSKPKSGKSEFFDSHVGKTRRHVIDLEAPPVASKKSSVNIRENNHNKPNKRPRIESSSAKALETLAIPLVNSQDDISPGPMIVSPNEIGPLDMETARGGLIRTPNIKVNLPARRPNSSPSPDELFNNEDMKAAQHANQQEKSASNIIPAKIADQMIKKRLDDLLKSPPKQKCRRGTSSIQQTSDHVSQQNKSMSRMDQRLSNGSDSPDILHGDATTGFREDFGLHRDQASPKSEKSRPERFLKKSIQNAGRKQNRKSVTNDHIVATEIDMFTWKSVIAREMDLFLDKEDESLTIGIVDALLSKGPIFQISTRKIIKLALTRDEPDTRVVVYTNLVKSAENSFMVDFMVDFNSLTGRDDFFKTLKALTHPTVRWCTSQWLDKFFHRLTNREGEVQDFMQGHGIKGSIVTQQQSPTLTKTATSAKTRLIDNLDAPRKQTIISGAERSGLGHTSPWRKRKDSTSDIPVSDVQSVLRTDSLTDRVLRKSERTTRSTAGVADKLEKLGPFFHVKSPGIFETLTQWKQPLVYPYNGKKRETVQFEDLQRLDDDEFLNDNLVCLFLRYLEEQADKEQMKRIHFFNSFLFESLTKDVKSRREINFDAVKKWTSKVDLFSRDFVVIPVNENLHWFVMIVCNLSYFKRKHAPRLDDEDEDNRDQIMQSLEPADEDTSKTILKSDLEDLREASMRDSFAEVSLDEHDSPKPSINTPKSQMGGRGRKKPRKSLQRYEIDKPVIITLDSLDQPRSLTASLLRQYIVAEARDKQGWEIDGNEIKGMTAKGIPHQNNFSDCGLYLCMYLEQFILEPYEFVRRILQRSNEAGWPRKIESSGLRDRLRRMLLSLHNQQSGQASDRIPPLGSILVDMSMTEAEDDHTPEPSAVVATQKRRLFQKSNDKDIEFVDDSDDPTVPEDRVVLDSIDDWKHMVNKPIAIDDEEFQLHIRKSPRAKKQTPTISPFFPKPVSKPGTLAESTEIDGHKHTDPVLLANHLRLQRSPERREESHHTKGGRSDSVSTDFLTSGEAYELDTPQVEPSQSLVRTSLSPDKTLSPLEKRKKKKSPRKSSQKFRALTTNSKLDANEVESVEDEFQGFPDFEAPDTLQQETVVDHGSGGSNGTLLMKRKSVESILKGGKHKGLPGNDTETEPQMLV